MDLFRHRYQGAGCARANRKLRTTIQNFFELCNLSDTAGADGHFGDAICNQFNRIQCIRRAQRDLNGFDTGIKQGQRKINCGRFVLDNHDRNDIYIL